MSEHLDDAVKAVVRDLVFRHHQAAREGREVDRSFLCGLMVDLERAYPDAAKAVLNPDA